MGGHNSGGLFPGTHGMHPQFRLSEDNDTTASLLKQNSSKPNPRKIYFANQQLLKHTTEAEYGGRKAGIIGGHEKSSFEAKGKELGISIEKRTPDPNINGVERVDYRLPKRDASGKPTGEFQTDVKTKTIYDSAVISTVEYIARGIQAANEAASHAPSGKLGHRWAGVDDHGVTWVGYIGSDGNVKTFYPQ